MIGSGSKNATKKPPPQQKLATKVSIEQIMMQTDLQDQLLELQAEFDHYKEQKKEQVQELMDKVDKFGQLQAELELYQSQGNLQ